MTKVLIIDDQETSALIIFDILIEKGYNCFPMLTSQVNLEYRKFKELFKYYIADSNEANRVNLKNYIADLEINLFIVDIDLKNQTKDESGKLLAKSFLHIEFPNVPILYVSQHPGKVVTDILRNIDDFLQKTSIGSKRMREYLRNNLPFKIQDLLKKQNVQ